MMMKGQRLGCTNAARFITALLASTAIAGAAHAVGTQAGTDVSNTFTLNYDVNNTPQTEINNIGGNDNDPDGPTVFRVDRVINLTVTADAGFVTVNPGEDNTPTNPVELTYTVVNLGNDRQRFQLDLVQGANGDNLNSTDVSSVPAGDLLDNFDVPSADLSFFAVVDTTPDDGTDNPVEVAFTPGSALPFDILPDDSFEVIVRGDIPAAALDGDVAEFTLAATALTPDISLDASFALAENLVVAESATPDANNVVTDNVFLDGAGTLTSDAATDGVNSDTHEFRVAAADLSGAKTVAILADGTETPAFDCATGATPATLPTDVFSIPGACVEYTITVENSGSVTATNIDILDVLPAGITQVDVRTTGTWAVAPTFATPTDSPAGVNTNNGVVCDGTPTLTAGLDITTATIGSESCVVHGTGGQLAAGATAEVRIRATISEGSTL